MDKKGKIKAIFQTSTVKTSLDLTVLSGAFIVIRKVSVN